MVVSSVVGGLIGGSSGAAMVLGAWFFFFSSRRRHTRCSRDWSSDVCSSDLMDAFYASVELLRYPELRGRPLVVGGRRRSAPDESGGTPFPALRDYKGRGVITTATYEARAFGVHSGMALMKAAKLAPDALLLPADFDEYRRYSRLFKDAVRAVAPQLEDRGIDEIYVDLTGLV